MIVDRIFDWICGWRKHRSSYIEEAIARRNITGVKTYINGLTLMLVYKKTKVVFSATPFFMPGETVDDYIQKHIDEVIGLTPPRYGEYQ